MITLTQTLKTVNENVSHRAHFLASILNRGFALLENGDGRPEFWDPPLSILFVGGEAQNRSYVA